MKRPTFKRVLAYLIDMLIISIIASMFSSIEFLNPYLEDYQKTYNEYMSQVSELTNEDILNNTKIQEYAYDIEYYGVYISITTVVISLFYFVFFQHFNKGKTIGKALLDIEVVDKSMEKASLLQLFIRTLIIDGVFLNTLSIIFILTMSKGVYLKASNALSVFEVAIYSLTIIMLMFRNDKRGPHDLLAGTVVVSSSELEEFNSAKEKKAEAKKVKENNKVKEAKVTEKKTKKGDK